PPSLSIDDYGWTQRVTALKTQGQQTTIQWVPGHHSIKGNKKANQVAKRAAGKPLQNESRELSMAYTHRACTEAIKACKQRWLVKALGCRTQAAQRTYRAQPG
ncbi:hypothetical protein T310_5922, partial [Rasamsonia emersonii CBS 393.64]